MSKRDLGALLRYLRDEDFMDNFTGRRRIDYLNKQFEVKVRPDSAVAKHRLRKQAPKCSQCNKVKCRCTTLFDSVKKNETRNHKRGK